MASTTTPPASSAAAGVSLPRRVVVSLLDYGAGNVRSVRNALLSTGYEVVDITSPEQIAHAECIVFPGVGSYGTAMRKLRELQFEQPLRDYLQDFRRPYLGICLGMQCLFDGSDENPASPEGVNHDAIPGLGVVPGRVVKFNANHVPVPHIGWNGRILHQQSPVFHYTPATAEVYFVHSYYVPITAENQPWVLSTTTYGEQNYVSSIQRGAVCATQFHPEKSGTTGLQVLQGFLEAVSNGTLATAQPLSPPPDPTLRTALTKRIVVALDVRSNDDGDLVVTKGDQYDVREKVVAPPVEPTQLDPTSTRPHPPDKGQVRNLGKPVRLAQRYYEEGADEIAFLNITSFRQGVIEDMPMLAVLEEASKNIFVPLTVGGGIRSYTDPVTQQTWTALEVAARYFRAGADKVSLGSDAVYAAEEYLKETGDHTGATSVISTSSIATISHVYGAQAVVISIDPKRVYLASSTQAENLCTDPTFRHVIVDLTPDTYGPNGEQCCWYQCTVNGGRETRDICAVTVARIAETLGAGEIMLNCIDMDGQGKGYDIPLLRAVSEAVSIPVIASSGAGTPEHFSDVFAKTRVQAALAAGMFHRKEVEISAVKQHMRDCGLDARQST